MENHEVEKYDHTFHNPVAAIIVSPHILFSFQFRCRNEKPLKSNARICNVQKISSTLLLCHYRLFHFRNKNREKLFTNFQSICRQVTYI